MPQVNKHQVNRHLVACGGCGECEECRQLPKLAEQVQTPALTDQAALPWAGSKEIAVLFPILAKACYEESQYMVGLRDSATIRFGHAIFAEDERSVSLMEVYAATGIFANVNTRGGIDVAIDHIVWAIEGPEEGL